MQAVGRCKSDHSTAELRLSESARQRHFFHRFSLWRDPGAIPGGATVPTLSRGHSASWTGIAVEKAGNAHGCMGDTGSDSDSDIHRDTLAQWRDVHCSGKGRLDWKASKPTHVRSQHFHGSKV
eukprot:2187616-Rhodomonas_salina.1